MLYDAVERVVSVLLNNFSSDLAALATAKGETITTSATVIGRRPRSWLADETTPAIGVWAARAVTQARRQDLRDAQVTVVVDYVAHETNADRLLVQCELAAEAVLRSIDRVGGIDHVLDAGGPAGSVTVEIAEPGMAEGSHVIEGWVRVQCLVVDRDVGLS